MKERCTISTTTSASRKPQYDGDPTLGSVMRRPKWVAALVFALAIAGGFAWLGQWQFDLAITREDPDAVDLEESRPLDAVTQPGESVTDLAAGAVVDTTGYFVPGDFTLVETRMNQGEQGVWVTGHFVSEAGHLPVAVGWAPDLATAEQAAQSIDASLRDEPEIVQINGRYMPPDAAFVPPNDVDPMLQTSMVPGFQVNVWQPFEGPSYSGFLVMDPDRSVAATATEVDALGLEAIDSLPPLPVETVNWLNVFYALEWVVFGGFAVFFWYRLARDDWERAHELQLLRLAEADATPAAVAPEITPAAH